MLYFYMICKSDKKPLGNRVTQVPRIFVRISLTKQTDIAKRWRLHTNDILIASKNEDDHQHHLRLLFERLDEYGVVINIEKCVFGQSDVQFLGYTIDKHGTRPLDSKVQSIRNFPQPSNNSQLKRFLGMLNYYRRFLPHAVQAQAPLLACLVGNKKNDKTLIDWTPEKLEAFNKCKNDLANAAILAHPSSDAPLSLMVDASDTAIGGVVNQFKDRCWQPLAFLPKN